MGGDNFNDDMDFCMRQIGYFECCHPDCHQCYFNLDREGGMAFHHFVNFAVCYKHDNSTLVDMANRFFNIEAHLRNLDMVKMPIGAYVRAYIVLMVTKEYPGTEEMHWLCNMRKVVGKDLTAALELLILKDEKELANTQRQLVLYNAL